MDRFHEAVDLMGRHYGAIEALGKVRAGAVLDLVASGLKYREIAELLSASVARVGQLAKPMATTKAPS